MRSRSPVRKHAVRICTASLALVIVGCATGPKGSPPPPLTARQREQMQTKELQGSFEHVMSATIAVLQDNGWRIDTVDSDVGIIQAASLKRQALVGPHEDWMVNQDPDYARKLQQDWEKYQKGKKDAGPVQPWTRWEQLTAHAERWGTQRTRLRINITKHGFAAPLTYGSNKQITTESGKEVSQHLEDAAVYQFLFQEIQRALFVRQGLEGS